MASPATAEVREEHQAASGDALLSPPSGERALKFFNTPDTAVLLVSDTVLTEVVYPLQDRLGGLANQLSATLLAFVILSMIVFPASFRGTWKTALAKIMFWLY